MGGITVALVPVTGAATFASAFLALDTLDGRTARRSLEVARSGLSRARDGVRLLAGSSKLDVTADIPVMLDVVTLGLSAGLSFDSSLELYCARYHNVLSAALNNERLRWQLGVETRSEGLRALGSEYGQGVLAEMATVVEESLELGLPLAGALEREAGQLRAEQRARLEERIEQVPVRMLIPLGTLIVPAMLLAILGPLVGSAVGIG